MELSEREQELLTFIKNSNGAMINEIEVKLSPKHVGALGKLLRQNLIKKDKRRVGEGYNVKITTVYVENKGDK